MRLYHRTTQEAALAIRESGFRVGRENTGALYFSNRLDGQATGYGQGVVEVEVPEDLVELDDEFPDGEQHFTLLPRHLDSVRVITDETLDG